MGATRNNLSKLWARGKLDEESLGVKSRLERSRGNILCKIYSFIEAQGMINKVDFDDKYNGIMKLGSVVILRLE